MRQKRSKYRIRTIFSLSNINTYFLQLILCIFVSQKLLGNPLYGAGLFLFSNIWILYFQANLRHISPVMRKKSGYPIMVLLAVSVLVGLGLVFIYPIAMKSARANLVAFFVLLIAARIVLSGRIAELKNKPRATIRIILNVAFQVLFVISCALFAFWRMDNVSAWTVTAWFALTGIFVPYQSALFSSLGRYVAFLDKDKLGGMAAYRIFSNMTLYSQVAFSLAILMYVCYVSLGSATVSTFSYLLMGVWLIFVLLLSELFTWVVNRQGWKTSLNLFIVGAAMWIVGSVKMYDATGIWDSSLWTVFWGFGLACITSALNHYNGDFEMVANVAGKSVSIRELYFRSMFTQVVAVLFSNLVMLIVLAVWAFAMPTNDNAELPVVLRRIMIQLPVLFMIVSVVFALRQPLDERNRQKLRNYSAGTSRNDPTRENLQKRLVEKIKVRFGVKIIAFFVRPFLRLKVSGKELMDQENFPSIFVCNHGIIYGPIAAVIYLPTYFRPWIDHKMVDRDMAAAEMKSRFIYRIPLLSDRAKMWIARQLARPVTWALNSFNPIPVEKSNMRNVVSTFGKTVEVLTEGDNVLIFPERPLSVIKNGQTTVRHLTDSVGGLYTGFANIGRLYYEQTGKELRFYPIFANRRNRTFRIGEPVVFCPSNYPQQEKHRIARTLQEEMLAMSKING